MFRDLSLWKQTSGCMPTQHLNYIVKFYVFSQGNADTTTWSNILLSVLLNLQDMWKMQGVLFLLSLITKFFMFDYVQGKISTSQSYSWSNNKRKLV